MADGLVAVGPLDPDHGFPLWFEDSSGTRLELGLDPTDPKLPALEPPTPRRAGREESADEYGYTVGTT